MTTLKDNFTPRFRARISPGAFLELFSKHDSFVASKPSIVPWNGLP